MNNQSRYNFILGSLVKKDFMKFDELAKAGIKENLLADQFDQNIVENYLRRCDVVKIAPTSERRIISQINEMILMTKHSWNYDNLVNEDIDLYEQNRRNNKTVMLTLPETYSVNSMMNALEGIED